MAVNIDEREIRIERYGRGYIITRPTNDNWEEYAGVSLDWRRQPIVDDPFPTEDEARVAIAMIRIRSL